MNNSHNKAASKLNKYDEIKSVRTKIKKSVPKPVLCTPYKIEWPQIDQKVQERVITYLEKFFKENNMCPKQICKASLKNLPKDEKRARLRDSALKNKCSMISSIRKHVAFGIQEVTRNLENKNLSLIIVDRSSPWQLHRHLIQLAALRGCPTMAINQLSETMSPLLSMSRLCVFAIKNLNDENSSTFLPLVEFMTPLCPKYVIPWLEAENQLLEIKQESVNRIIEDNVTMHKVENVEDSVEMDKGELSNINENANGASRNYVKGEDFDTLEMEHDDCQSSQMSSADFEDQSPRFADLYIKMDSGNSSEHACEIVDVDCDFILNYNNSTKRECTVEKDSKLLIFTSPPKKTSIKRFHTAEVRKVLKNEYKRRKLN